MGIAKVLGASARKEGHMEGGDYNGLHQAALCRAKADWLVGINASRQYRLLWKLDSVLR